MKSEKLLAETNDSRTEQLSLYKQKDKDNGGVIAELQSQVRKLEQDMKMSVLEARMERQRFVMHVKYVKFDVRERFVCIVFSYLSCIHNSLHAVLRLVCRSACARRTSTDDR
jgi:hypothetical protein